MDNSNQGTGAKFSVVISTFEYNYYNLTLNRGDRPRAPIVEPLVAYCTLYIEGGGALDLVPMMPRGGSVWFVAIPNVPSNKNRHEFWKNNPEQTFKRLATL